MKKLFDEIVKEVESNREEITEKLVRFSMTDMMLFWGQERNLVEKQQEIWNPILKWAEEVMETTLTVTQCLIPGQSLQSGDRIRCFIHRLSSRELAAFYLVAVRTNSIILASAFVKKKINAEDAFKAAFLEEKFNQETWGSEEEAIKRQDILKEELKELEELLK